MVVLINELLSVNVTQRLALGWVTICSMSYVTIQLVDSTFYPPCDGKMSISPLLLSYIGQCAHYKLNELLSSSSSTLAAASLQALSSPSFANLVHTYPYLIYRSHTPSVTI